MTETVTATERLLCESLTYAFVLGQAYELGHFDKDEVINTIEALIKTVAEMIEQ